MSDIIFTGDGWEDYLYWQNQDKKTLKKSTLCLPLHNGIPMKAKVSLSR